MPTLVVYEVAIGILIAIGAASVVGTTYYHNLYSSEASKNSDMNETIQRLQTNILNLNVTINSDKSQLATLQMELNGNLTGIQGLESRISQLQIWLAGNETALSNLEQYKTSTFVYGTIAVAPGAFGSIASITFSYPTNGNNTFTDYFAIRSYTTSYNVYLVTGVRYTVTITSDTGNTCIANPYPFAPSGPSMMQDFAC